MERVDCDADGYVGSIMCLKSMYELDETKNMKGKNGQVVGTGWDVDDGR